jgi:methyl-accepting chemotaxis protein
MRLGSPKNVAEVALATARKLLPRAFGFAQSAGSNGLGEDPLHGLLEQVIEDLQNLNRNTERDFLKIGEMLIGFLGSADRVSSGLAGLTDQISGEQGQRAYEALTRALEGCRRMESRTVGRNRELGSLRDGAVSVRNTSSGFRDAMSTIRALCTLTCIETARMGAVVTDFGSLTEDVKSLADSMESRVEHVLETAVSLGRRIECTLGTLAGVDLQLRDLTSVITGVMNSLGAFSAQQARALAISARLASDSRSVSAAINDAVKSIQFHDITRQQVEHIIDALKRLCVDGRARGPGAPQNAAVVLALQSSQLVDAADRFAASVDCLTRDLDSIAASVREMTRAGSSLLDASGDDRESFFRGMEHCLTVILDVVGSYRNAGTETETAARELAATVGSMRNAAEAIRVIDTQILRTALNASIRAAHIGGMGETLSVLANALRDLAVSSDRRSDVVAEALDSMAQATGNLSAGGDRAGAAAHETIVADELRATIEDLHSWSVASTVCIQESMDLGSRLCDDLFAARSGLRVGELFSAVAARCRENLTQLAGGSEPPPARGERVAPGPGLEDLERRYTMQSEREVHASIAGAADAGPPSHPQSDVSRGISGEEGDDLGDNVELF